MVYSVNFTVLKAFTLFYSETTTQRSTWMYAAVQSPCVGHDCPTFEEILKPFTLPSECLKIDTKPDFSGILTKLKRKLPKNKRVAGEETWTVCPRCSSPVWDDEGDHWSDTPREDCEEPTGTVECENGCSTIASYKHVALKTSEVYTLCSIEMSCGWLIFITKT